MAFDVASLEPCIRRILTSPGIDLSTISAKRVRKQLVEDDPNVSAELVKTYKQDIDLIIVSVYEDVCAATIGEEGGEDGQSDSGEGQSFGKKEREDMDEDEEQEVATSSPSEVMKKNTRRLKKEEELTDAEIARQFDSKINIIDIGRGGTFMKEYTLSAPLAALLGVKRMCRPLVVKHIWGHIKEKGLQDPTDEREIVCDESMKAVFGVERIHMFEMNKALRDHLYEDT